MMTETVGTIMDIRHQAQSQNIPGQDHEQPAVKNGAIYVKENKGA